MTLKSVKLKLLRNQEKLLYVKAGINATNLKKGKGYMDM